MLRLQNQKISQNNSRLEYLKKMTFKKKILPLKSGSPVGPKNLEPRAYGWEKKKHYTPNQKKYPKKLRIVFFNCKSSSRFEHKFLLKQNIFP
jgi:hypothetical protein